MMTKPIRKTSGWWRDLPWASMGLVILVGASWTLSGAGARAVHAGESRAAERVPASPLAATVRRLREALGGVPPARASGAGSAAEPNPLASGPSVAFPGPAAAAQDVEEE